VVLNNKKDKIDISVTEEFAANNFVMSLNGFDVEKGEGTFGFGTNKQVAFFSDISMQPIPQPKSEKAKIEKEDLLALVAGINGPKLNVDGPNVNAPTPSVELPPSVSVASPELPNAALGLDGGMAPKIETLAQEEMPTVKTCSNVKTPEGRNAWCNLN